MFIPANTTVFTAAFTGALAGIMSTIGIPSSNTTNASYASAASLAEGYAEVVDMLWDVSPTTQLDVELIQGMCFATWEDLAPIDSYKADPASWALRVGAMIKVIHAAHSEYTAQGITEPLGGLPVTQLTTDNVAARVARTPIADGAVLSLRYIVSVHSTDGSGAVLGEWEVKGAYQVVAGVLTAAYAAVITNTFIVGAPVGPTLTLNGNTDVDLNVTGIAATGLTWLISEYTL